MHLYKMSTCLHFRDFTYISDARFEFEIYSKFPFLAYLNKDLQLELNKLFVNTEII